MKRGGDCMSNYLIELGTILRNARKIRGFTIQELADKIQKSKSTLSKYERGEIAVDILTVNDIALALNVRVEDLLPQSENFVKQFHPSASSVTPSFFRDNNYFYSYYYDGRNKSIVCSKFIVQDSNTDNTIHVTVYMNVKDLEYPQICENTYHGQISHHDIITRMDLINRDTVVERATIAILSPFVENDVRWGLWTGISIRPVMPASIKMLFTKTPQKLDLSLKKKLVLSNEDYKQIKHYNMFPVF